MLQAESCEGRSRSASLGRGDRNPPGLPASVGEAAADPAAPSLRVGTTCFAVGQRRGERRAPGPQEGPPGPRAPLVPGPLSSPDQPRDAAPLAASPPPPPGLFARSFDPRTHCPVLSTLRCLGEPPRSRPSSEGQLCPRESQEEARQSQSGHP